MPEYERSLWLTGFQSLFPCSSAERTKNTLVCAEKTTFHFQNGKLSKDQRHQCRYSNFVWDWSEADTETSWEEGENHVSLGGRLLSTIVLIRKPKPKHCENRVVFLFNIWIHHCSLLLNPSLKGEMPLDSIRFFGVLNLITMILDFSCAL